MTAGELTLNVHCSGPVCTCQPNPLSIKVSKNDTPEGAKGFFTLFHEINGGKTFTLKGTLHGGEELSTRYDIPGVKKVSVFYWKGDAEYERPLLLEIVKNGSRDEKLYYYKYDGEEVTNSHFWSHQRHSISLQVMLDDRNCGRNHAVPLNIKDPEKGTLPDGVGSNCLKTKRKIESTKLAPPLTLPGTEYTVKEYNVSGRDTKISRATYGKADTTGIDLPKDYPVSKVKVYSYPGPTGDNIDIPLMLQFIKQGSGTEESMWFESNNTDGISWQEVRDPNEFYRDDEPTEKLSEKLDEVACFIGVGVTIDLTRGKYKSGESYCCGKKHDGQKVSVTGSLVASQIPYFKHHVNVGSALAGIKYYENDQPSGRKRITASELRFPVEGSLNVYAFYCQGNDPVLIYLSSPGEPNTKGWYKKNPSSDTWEPFSGIKNDIPDNIKGCDGSDFEQLVNELKQFPGCNSYQTCKDLQYLPLRTAPGTLGPQGDSVSGGNGDPGKDTLEVYKSDNSDSSGSSDVAGDQRDETGVGIIVGSLLGKLLGGLVAGLGKLDNRKISRNLITLGDAGYEFTSKVGKDTLKAALEITEPASTANLQAAGGTPRLELPQKLPYSSSQTNQGENTRSADAEATTSASTPSQPLAPRPPEKPEEKTEEPALTEKPPASEHQASTTGTAPLTQPVSPTAPQGSEPTPPESGPQAFADGGVVSAPVATSLWLTFGASSGTLTGAGGLTGLGWWMFKRSKGDPWVLQVCLIDGKEYHIEYT